MLVVNASNIDGDFAWIEGLPRPEGVTLENRSDQFALLALQGPRSLEILRQITATDLAAIKYYGFVRGDAGRKSGADLAHRLHRRGRIRALRRPP